ncbi:MAG TPA: hypothetical protein VF384_05335 [Planctomycetota bacterium]
MSALAVGLAVEWYSADPAIEALCTKNLPEPRQAPMVGFLTPEGSWIDGYSGWKDTPDFLPVLERVEQSPLRNAAPAVRKQLEKHAAAVGPAADKGDWQPVLIAAREAKKSSGRCPERDAIQAAEKKAREWVAAELDAVVQQAKVGGDNVALRKKLGVVKQKFAGEPEAADVETGLKALTKLNLVREVEAGGNPARDLRERHAAPFKGTRWAAMFDKPATAGGEK